MRNLLILVLIFVALALTTGCNTAVQRHASKDIVSVIKSAPPVATPSKTVPVVATIKTTPSPVIQAKKKGLEARALGLTPPPPFILKMSPLTKRLFRSWGCRISYPENDPKGHLAYLHLKNAKIFVDQNSEMLKIQPIASDTIRVVCVDKMKNGIQKTASLLVCRGFLLK